MKATNRFCRRFLFVLCLFLFSASSKGRVQAASLNASSLNLLKGQSFSLYLSEEEDTVSFESKNPGIAAVSEDGTVTGVSGGIAKIICDDGSRKYQCTVNVYDPGMVNTNSVMNGIDVSVWQGRVDYERVKAAGIDFVIMRAGYSTEPLSAAGSSKNSPPPYRRTAMTRAGIPPQALWTASHPRSETTAAIWSGSPSTVRSTTMREDTTSGSTRPQGRFREFRRRWI